MSRNTIQKQTILDYLYSIKSHPSADQVYLAVKKKLPTISKATVYRILKSFSQQNIIREINSEVSRYDADMSKHTHFICRRCKSVFDMLEFDNQIKLPKNIKNGQVDNYQLNFFGFCNKCK